MSDYHKGGEDLTSRDDLIELASTTHNGWDWTETYGLIIGVAGLAETAYDAIRSAGVETIGPAIVALGGFAVYLWANRKKEVVHNFMDYHGIEHQDFDRRF
jgi:hypothetical protein